MQKYSLSTLSKSIARSAWFALLTSLLVITLIGSTPVRAQTQAQNEVRIREYFKDAPAMIEIAQCESRFRQFTDSGNVLYGGYSKAMVGIYQIYESVHASTALSLGLDLKTVEGNIAYARLLFALQGSQPWSDCWSGEEVPPGSVPVISPTFISTSTLAQVATTTSELALTAMSGQATTSAPTSTQPSPLTTSSEATTTTTAATPASPAPTAPQLSPPATSNSSLTTIETSTTQGRTMQAESIGAKTFDRSLYVGLVHTQVLSLQQALNKLGHPIASEGAGSPGQETTRYGALTRAAVQKFQCEKKIVCAGDDDMTGYGVFGPRTRTALILATTR